MLTHILPVAVPDPRPAHSHILNQPIVGIGSSAGDSDATDRGTAGTVAPVESITSMSIRADLELTPWGKWLAFAEELAGHSLEDDDDAYPAFERGVYPEVYVGALAEPCAMCKTPGAPAHEPSKRCQYRPKVVTHCTCSACF
jgi:hypothetical protein